MKYTIEGFSQEYAITLRKNIFSGNKEKQIKIDCTDLVILRWFVDFFPNMKKITVDGVEYAWLSHKKLEEDLPILDISKRACIERMQKLVEFGILKYKLVKEGGTFSLYAFGDNYINLLRSNVPPVVVQSAEGIRSNDIGAYGQTDNKDKSIKDASNNDSSNKDKKESKTGSFDAIIAGYTKDEKTVELLQDWLKVRKAKRAAMTDRAIQMNIDKLSVLALQSNMDVNTYLEEIIRRGWAAFYEIKSFGNKKNYNAEEKVTINGKEYILKNGKYYIPGGSGIAVDPNAVDDLPF